MMAHCSPLSKTEASPETKPMLEPKTFKFQGRSKKLRGLEKCGRERSMSREFRLRRLQLLQADHVRLCSFEPGKKVAEALVNIVDVEGRDFHCTAWRVDTSTPNCPPSPEVLFGLWECVRRVKLARCQPGSLRRASRNIGSR